MSTGNPPFSGGLPNIYVMGYEQMTDPLAVIRRRHAKTDARLPARHLPRASEDGFTLVELMVVMSIMVIVMGLGAFALFSYWRAQSLTGAANQVLSDMRDAQVRAQAEVRTYRVWFDLGSNSYLIERQEGGGFVVVQRRDFEPGIVIDSVEFISTAGCLVPNASNEAYFCPRGVSSDGNVVIRSTRLNQDRQLVLTGLTARSEVR